MAKLYLDEEKVADALEQLEEAANILDGSSDSLSSGVSTILSARGIEYVDTSSIQNIAGLPDACLQLISNLESEISSRVDEIKAYNDDVDNMSILDRIFSTGALLATKFVEGFAKGGEDILDGFASAAGFLAGFVSKDAQDAIGEFVKKDHVGDAFDSLYDNQLSHVVQASYAKEDGVAAKIFEVGGTMTAFSAALAVGGAATGTALTHSAAAGYTLAGITGLGAGTEGGLQSGKTYNEAFATGVKTAAISVATAFVINNAIKFAVKTFKGSGTTSEGATAEGGTPEGPSPEGGTGSTTEGATGSTSKGGTSSGTSSEGASTQFKSDVSGSPTEFDSADDLVQAVKDGKISAEEAKAYANAKFQKASAPKGSGQEAVQEAKAAARAARDWHPDKINGLIDDAAKSVEPTSGDVGGGSTSINANGTDGTSIDITGNASSAESGGASTQFKTSNTEGPSVDTTSDSSSIKGVDIAPEGSNGLKISSDSAGGDVTPVNNSGNSSSTAVADAEGGAGSQFKTSNTEGPSVDTTSDSSSIKGTDIAPEGSNSLKISSDSAGGDVTPVNNSGNSSSTALANVDGEASAQFKTAGSDSIGMSDAEIEAARANIGDYKPTDPTKSTTQIADSEVTEFVKKENSTLLSKQNNVQLSSSEETQSMIQELNANGKQLTEVSSEELSHIKGLQNKRLSCLKQIEKIRTTEGLSETEMASQLEPFQSELSSVESELSQYKTLLDGREVVSYTTERGITTEGGAGLVSGSQVGANSDYNAYSRLMQKSAEVAESDPELAAKYAEEALQKKVNMQSAGDVITHTEVFKVTDIEPQLPAVTETQLPAVVETGETGLVPVETGETGLVPFETGETGLVPVETGETGLVPVETGETGLVPVETGETGLVPVETGETGLVPVEPGETGLVPVEPGETGLVPVEPGETGLVPVETDPVVDPTPVVTTTDPAVIVPAPFVPEEKVNIPEITPTVDSAVIPTEDPVVTPTEDPVVTPTVDPTVTPTVTPTVEPTVTPTVTPTVDPTVTPETPQEITEYAPIPNTGIGGSTSSNKLGYAIPTILGIGAGAGLVGTVIKHNKDDEDDENKDNKKGDIE